MSTNPRMYETQYGFDVLDTFHNFFPEMMYDSTLFPNNTLAWMRHRIATLFPDVYVRQQNMYRMYSATDRARMMEEWRQSQAPPSPIAPTTMNNTINTPQRANPWAHVSAAVREAPSTPVNQMTARHTVMPGAPVRRPQRTGVTSQFVPASTLDMTGSVNDLIANMIRQPASPFPGDDRMLLNMLAALGPDILYEDVVVRPTVAQIEAGSRIVEHAPEGMNCAICQERGEIQSWRHLNCSHYFHNTCISTWYERSVECPVCRADIRGPTAAESSTPTIPVSPLAPAEATGGEPSAR